MDDTLFQSRLGRRWRHLGQRLYVRIWLAVVLAVAVLILLVGWAWRLAAEQPLSEVHVRNAAGEIIGSAQRRPRHRPPSGIEEPPSMEPGTRGERGDRPEPPPEEPPGSFPQHANAVRIIPGGPGLAQNFGSGPEFLVTLKDGQVLHIHLPRPPNRSPFSSRPYGFFWLLAMVGLGVALATYPIVRRLTKRLEALQHGVEQWGSGDLSARVPLQGNDEVGYLAARFNLAAGRIETLVKSHKSLLANASHELRSPLARIRMGLELMGEQTSPTFKNEISRNIAELDQLITEILLASRLDAKEADMGTVESVDLTGLIAEECAHTGALFEALPDAGPPATQGTDAQTVLVQGVVKLLRRVVRNLLENGRRYSQGDITVTLQRQGSRAIVCVRDTGPGVPELLRERIFEPFYRLPGASEQSGGVGLGLALVKSITERTGGSVRCEANPGGGACFVLDLPLQKTR
jgi:signal transduction histidine kinase